MRATDAVKALVALTLVACIFGHGVVARSIPASSHQIRELADVVLAGEISASEMNPESQIAQISIAVRAVIFDRDEVVEQGQIVQFRAVIYPQSSTNFEAGKTYVVSLGNCLNGEYVSIGSQFASTERNDGFDTSLWVDFEPLTPFEEIRRRLSPPAERDSLLTDARCNQAWGGKREP